LFLVFNLNRFGFGFRNNRDFYNLNRFGFGFRNGRDFHGLRFGLENNRDLYNLNNLFRFFHYRGSDLLYLFTEGS
jgi:hypothetical protein